MRHHHHLEAAPEDQLTATLFHDDDAEDDHDRDHRRLPEMPAEPCDWPRCPYHQLGRKAATP